MGTNIILSVIQITLGIIIIVLVLLQQQDSGFYARSNTMKKTRRGAEKLVYNATIIFGTLFVIVSIANFLV